MIDVSTTDYAFQRTDFDPDAHFAEPAVALPPPPLTLQEKLGLALVAVGILATLSALFSGPLNGTWGGIALSFGALGLGGIIAFHGRYAGNTPGIENDGIWFHSMLARGGLAWVAGLVMTALYIAIYFKPEWLGYDAKNGVVTGGLVEAVQPLATALNGGGSSEWFLYGVLYTLAVIVFGTRTAMKYRHVPYQLVRTCSVVFFQLGFAFLMPNILQKFQQPYYEFNGVWPLKSDYLWPSKVSSLVESPAALGTFMMFWGLVMTFAATPVLTYFFGKRWYCSWVCGCGGLAETLGDPWRQLSDKSTTAWKYERVVIHLVLVIILAVTAFLWVHYSFGLAGMDNVANITKWIYGLLIGAMFSGVAGVGFYPLLGSRFWCRFGCPMAAYLGILQRLFSRFRITTNGAQCMSCGNCNTYCEMGIDVQAYAQAGENIVRSSCVGCGVCSAVCPRGVLKLENGKTHTDRYDGAADPLGELMANLKQPLAPQKPVATELPAAGRRN